MISDSFLSDLRQPKLQLADQICSIADNEQFNELAAELLSYQADRIPAFREYLQRTDQSDRWDETRPPFLPIELFKYHHLNAEKDHELSFKSSGTTSMERSTHYVHSAQLYDRLSKAWFERLYGPLKDLVILAMLPSYLEQGDSSLVYMVKTFIDATEHHESRFIADHRELASVLETLKKVKQKTLLIGVSYALLDFSEVHNVSYPELIVMETGGMKGRKKEMIRSELHAALKRAFPASPIHSEYGMTELLSQAYQRDGQWFEPPPWMRVCTTDISDPFRILPPGRRGLIAVVDLANAYSCSFIQTRDIGVVDDDGRFQVEGRLDRSDIRGCNLLYT